MSDIFLAYAHKDHKKAALLISTFELRGWKVEWDKNIPPGWTWEDWIDERLKTDKVVVCLWSRASVKSQEFKNEIKSVYEKVLPVLIEEVELPYDWRYLQAADLHTWRGRPDHEGLMSLITEISERLRKAESKSTPSQNYTAPQVDIHSEYFSELVDRFIRSEKKLGPEEKKTRLEFYTEYVDRLDTMDVDKKLEDIKRLNLQYLSEYNVEIAQLKQMLREVKLYSGKGEDFPDDLVYAIKYYQKAKELKPIDGIFGPATFLALIQQLGLKKVSSSKKV